MSEYQFYEFLAVDRRLGEEEMTELRKVSSRARITPTHFVNEYNYGDFKGDEFEFLWRYFDLHSYVANWGTRRFMVKVPEAILSPADVEPYCGGKYVFDFRKKGKSLILDFNSQDDEAGGWEEGSGWIERLAPVRDELMRGDTRALYIGWLLRVIDEDMAEDEIEPPVPPGLGKLSRPLASLVEFLRVDPDLVAAAAEQSGGAAEVGRDSGLAEWVGALPESEKTRLLLEAIDGADAGFGPKLLARFRAEKARDTKPSKRAASGGRTVAQLLEAAERCCEIREREEADRAAKALAKQRAAAAKARETHLDDLSTRQHSAWKKVESLVGETKGKSYEEAVALLVDLRELADRTKARAKFDEKFAALAANLSRRPALVARLKRERFTLPDSSSK